MILNLPQKELLHTLLEKYVCHQSNSAIEHAAIKHQRNHAVPEIQNMMERWYASLQSQPDYSVYSDDYYIAELWACWHNYSRIHLKNIQKSTNLNGTSIQQRWANARAVVDLGCGFGLTTAALKQIFPQSTVIGTNLDDTLQIQVARQLAREYNYNIVTELSDIHQPVDLIFASEYFEHWINPIEHLEEVITTLRPQALLIANAFGTRAIGHFTQYTHDGRWIDQKKIGRMFNTALRSMNYRSIKTGLWNNRPQLWARND